MYPWVWLSLHKKSVLTELLNMFQQKAIIHFCMLYIFLLLYILYILLSFLPVTARMFWYKEPDVKHIGFVVF